MVNVTVASYEELAEEVVPITNGEIFLMNDDKFYLNQWISLFKCQTKVGVEKPLNGDTITCITQLTKIHLELIKLFTCV